MPILNRRNEGLRPSTDSHCAFHPDLQPYSSPPFTGRA
jgi:hypothetical protein